MNKIVNHVNNLFFALPKTEGNVKQVQLYKPLKIHYSTKKRGLLTALFSLCCISFLFFVSFDARFDLRFDPSVQISIRFLQRFFRFLR